ncbi:MAG: hypothetical protein ACOYOT_11630 [Bacteroidales bacterium]
MKKSVLTLFLIAMLFFTIGLQVSLQAQLANVNKCQADKRLDSLSYIKIDKVIYYQTPIEIYDDSLISNNGFIPDWYPAFQVSRNSQRFKDNPQEVLKYLHGSIQMSEAQILDVINNRKHKVSPMPYRYVFGEVWFTYLASGLKIVVTLSKSNDKELPNLKFKLPVKKNAFDESVDTTKSIAYDNDFYILENGILKYPDQVYVDGLISNNSEYFVSLSLRHFKDMLYRTPTYKLSNRENGIRKFATMEKVANGHIMKSVNDNP